MGLTLFAGDGLSAASSVMAVDLNELSAAVLAPADDLLAFVDATNNSTKKESVSDFINAFQNMTARQLSKLSKLFKSFEEFQILFYITFLGRGRSLCWLHFNRLGEIIHKHL